jgi:hypothetical protein
MATKQTLVDNGNFIDIPELGLSIFKMSVNLVTIKPQSVIINTRDKDVYSLDSREFEGFPDGQTLGDTVIEYINNIAIGGSGGLTIGGSDSITTVSGQIDAVPVIGSKEIIFYGLPEPLTEEMVLNGSIQKIDADNIITDLDTSGLTISGNILTLPNIDDFVTGDKIAAALKSGLQGFDYLVNAWKVMIENPEWNHYTSVNNLVSNSGLAIGKYFVAFDCEAYRDFMIQLSGTESVGMEFKIYFTGDPTAAVPATDGTPGSTWKEKTTEVFGGAVTGLAVNEHEYINGKMPDRVMIEYSVQSVTNTVNIWIRKF